jgi:hypothetical protein
MSSLLASPVSERRYNLRKTIKPSAKATLVLKSNSPFVKGTYRIKSRFPYTQNVVFFFNRYECPRFDSLRREPYNPALYEPEVIVEDDDDVAPLATANLRSILCRGFPYWGQPQGDGLWAMYIRTPEEHQTHVYPEDFLSYWDARTKKWDTPEDVPKERGGTA